MGSGTGTPEADELEIRVRLVNKFEEENYPIEEPDPIEYIKIRMEELGLKQEALVPCMVKKVTYPKYLAANVLFHWK